MQIRTLLVAAIAAIATLSAAGHSAAQQPPPAGQKDDVAGVTVMAETYGSCIVVGAKCVPAAGYAAAYAKAIADKLDQSNKHQAEMSKGIAELSSTMQQMQKSFSEHVVASETDLRRSIARRFDALPAELLKSTAIAELRKTILADVDAKIAAIEKK